MFFKKLEIFGFKSFADKTVLNFEEGITAIVGPNGCGKSNIFDAIRWVLGEQSVKELRGSSMEDVIFSGTEKKPSLGFAEVSLSFSNETRMLPVEQDEVTITRRLFRSGESEYLLNKRTARLKDIQQMFMGTGIGTAAYSMVQQGKVDMVVNSKPEERREILDEASGITKYKAKKKEALNKLKATEDNLLRVNDITVEVKRQIGSIERQAKKAQRYKEKFEKLKVLEVQMARFQLGNYEHKKSEIQEKIRKHKEREGALQTELEDLNNLLLSEGNMLEEVEQKIHEVHAEEIKFEGHIDVNSRQIGFNEERISNIDQNAEHLTGKKEQLIERCRLQQEKIEDLKNQCRVHEETMQYNKQVLDEKKEELEVLENTISNATAKIKEHEEKMLLLTSQQVSIRNDLTDIMKEVQGGLARRRRLEMEIEKVSSEKQVIDQKLQNTDYQIHAINGTIQDLNVDRDKNNNILESLRSELTLTEEAIIELDKKKLFFKSQKEFIEKLHTQYHDMPDPIVEGRFITGTTPLEHHTGIIGKVKEVIALDEHKLSMLRNAFNEVGTSQLYEIICETKFIELDPQQISLKIEEISGEINKACVKKDMLSKNVKEQEATCQCLETEILRKEKEFSILEAQKKDILEETDKLVGEIHLVEEELVEVKQSLEEHKKREDEFNYKLDTTNQDLSWCQNDIKDKQTWIANKSKERENTTVNIAQLETELESGNDKLKNFQDNCAIYTEALDGWLEEMKKIDDEVSTQTGKKQGYLIEIDELNDKIENIRNDISTLKETLSDHQTQKEDLIQRINSIRTNISSFENELNKIQNDFHDIEMGEQELSFSEKTIRDRLFQSYKIDLDTFEVAPVAEATPRQNAESENQENQPSEQGEDQAEEQTTESPIQQPQPEQIIVEEPFNPGETEFELEKLRKKCDSFGAVNLVAIEEHEELKERFEFLTKQQSDLLEAKSQLMSTITKINRSTRQMFMDTFTKVSEEFRIYFRMLFGGGEAELILQDPENVLESGVDIIARPPGKKLQNMTLLSGGEKTLTAIALIFGVFKVNPSPFCVLDEIDAALDESNVGRFSYLLKDFAKIAQFIVITHNKKTIASADVMYGITMPEAGCSRLVSVKFSEEKEKEPELVPA